MIGDQLPPLEEIGEDIMRELGRRLKDPTLAERLPPGTLMSLATKYIVYLDMRARVARSDRQQEKQADILDLIENREMDASRRLEIIDGYIAQAEEDLRRVKARRREVSKEVTREAKVVSLVP